MVSIVITLFFLHGVIKIHYFGAIRLRNINYYSYKTDFIISLVNHISQYEFKSIVI